MLHPVPPMSVLPILPAVYLMKTRLHRLCRPAHVTRDDTGSRVLVQLDSDALLAEVALWSTEHLHGPERIAIRLGFGCSIDLAVPFDDRLLGGTVGDAQLPPSLELVAESHPSMSFPRPLGRSG
jgi:hypothetical protein